MACRLPPSFFKVVLDSSAHHLPLPPNFVSKHLKNKIPENPILQLKNGGFSWQLKIRQIDGAYSFADGWNNVVKDIQLTYGDFLVFRLVKPSTFDVSIYSPNGCEKDLYSKVQVEPDKDVAGYEEEEDLDVHENDVDYDNEEDEQEDEEEDENDDDEDEDEDVCDDVHDGDPFFKIVISKNHKHVMRLPSTFLKSAGIDYERRITLKDPVDKEWQLNLKLENCKLYKRYYLGSGWTQFVRDNDLSSGDKCVFKFIKSQDKLCLVKVTRKKPRPVARDPMVDDVVKRKTWREAAEHGGCGEVNGEEDCVEVVKTPCGKPPTVLYF